MIVLTKTEYIFSQIQKFQGVSTPGSFPVTAVCFWLRKEQSHQRTSVVCPEVEIIGNSYCA